MYPLTPIKSYLWISGGKQLKEEKTSFTQALGQGTWGHTYIHPLAQTSAEGKVVWRTHNLRRQVFALPSRQRSWEWHLSYVSSPFKDQDEQLRRQLIQQPSERMCMECRVGQKGKVVWETDLVSEESTKVVLAGWVSESIGQSDLKCVNAFTWTTNPPVGRQLWVFCHPSGPRMAQSCPL